MQANTRVLNMQRPFFTGEVATAGLRSTDTGNTRLVLTDMELYALLVANFNHTIKLVSGRPEDIAFGLANKALTTAKVIGKSSNSTELLVGSTVAQMIVASASLVSVASKGPTSAVVTIGATFAKKTSLALSLSGSDDKTAKCLAALTDMAASGLTTGLAASAAATGIGAVVLAGSIAQLILSAHQVHQACIAPTGA